MPQITLSSVEGDPPFVPDQLWKPPNDPSLHLPRILCLHGGGTNARIFRTQCRVIRARLVTFFRLVFVDAPYFSRPGPDVELVYADWGPFRSWRRPGYVAGDGIKLHHAEQGEIEKIDQSIRQGMDKDDELGATGAWVGLMGFSQGANIAASLLLRQQNQAAKVGAQTGRLQSILPLKTSFCFAVLLAGRAPLLCMEPHLNAHLAAESPVQSLLQLPTVHVHGLKDVGITMHRELLKCCERESTRVVKWDGDHRVPIKTQDVALLVIAVLDAASKGGVII
ncbi:serine hydrolase FSH [Dactylonectria macrodidyma]|uniref:Serine hydrolase FSH n=1 Tax=Dactylonectria macrodidyma TaxID=307937 RepID=A0A9P9ECB3_9HYPO|nr:serine hydrolase FSH [Dactylonectria macrodidyma]